MSDFRIHKTAVSLETSLNLMMKKSRHPFSADITRIYDAPVRMCTEVLAKVNDTKCLDSIQKIKLKYWPYQNYILSQLEEDTRSALCEDILLIQEHMSAK